MSRPVYCFYAKNVVATAMVNFSKIIDVVVFHSYEDNCVGNCFADSKLLGGCTVLDSMRPNEGA